MPAPPMQLVDISDELHRRLMATATQATAAQDLRAVLRDVKAELRRKQYDTKQVDGGNKKAAPAKKKATPAKKKATATAVPSAALRRSTRSTKGKK